MKNRAGKPPNDGDRRRQRHIPEHQYPMEQQTSCGRGGHHDRLRYFGSFATTLISN